MLYGACRRLVYLGLTVSLLLGTGCRRANPNQLVLLTQGGSTREAVNWAVAEFESENPGVQVTVIQTPGKDYYKKALTMLAGRAQVDVLWLGQGFGQFAGRNALMDLQPLMTVDKTFPLEDYDPSAMEWYRYRDQQYGIPYGVQLLVIAYNVDLFEQAGLPLPRPDWTLEDMLAKAKALNRPRPDRVAGLGLGDLDFRYYGLSLLNEDHTRFGLNTPTGRKWLQRNVDLLHEDEILQPGSDFSSLDSLNGFLNQTVAMIPAASWDLPELHIRARFRWDVVGIPTGFDGSTRVWASSSGFSITRASRNSAMAWKLLRKLTDAEFQRKLLTTQIPSLKSLRPEYLTANPPPPEHLAEALRMLEYMQPVPRIAHLSEVEAEWDYWMDLVLLKKIGVGEALDEAESHINRILEPKHGEATP